MLIVLKKSIRLELIGAFILMLLMVTYVIGRILLLAIQPYLREYYDELIANRPHSIDRNKLVYLIVFLRGYYLLVFCIISLVTFLIVRFNIRFRQFLREFGYSLLIIFVVDVVVVSTMRFILKIIP